MYIHTYVHKEEYLGTSNCIYRVQMLCTYYYLVTHTVRLVHIVKSKFETVRSQGSRGNFPPTKISNLCTFACCGVRGGYATYPSGTLRTNVRSQFFFALLCTWVDENLDFRNLSITVLNYLFLRTPKNMKTDIFIID